jgi:hypothetical protein
VGDEVVIGRVELKRRRHVRVEAESEGFHDRWVSRVLGEFRCGYI